MTDTETDVPTTLKADTPDYRRRAVWHVDEPARVDLDGNYSIMGDRVVVDLIRAAEHDPWEILWVTVSGRRILINEQIGRSNAKHLHSGRGLTGAPTWVQRLAAGYLAQCEAERLGHEPDVVLIHEDNSGAVYLTRAGETWSIGPIAPDVAGHGVKDADAWLRGCHWKPSEGDGQVPASRDKLNHIATWSAGRLTIHYDEYARPVAGAGGQIYLGLGKVAD
jgi:hypothetical protein